LSDLLLSAAMIVRDEERFIEECLLSIKEVVDEVVIVDTGSTDKTREIAVKHGAKVYDLPWTGNFAAARNRALEHSSGEWILYIT
jgi:glycosyltransferase involved in cell wall biosynthesis